MQVLDDFDFRRIVGVSFTLALKVIVAGSAGEDVLPSVTETL